MTYTNTKGNEMTQRKLTQGELQTVSNARNLLRQVADFCDYSMGSAMVLEDLARMASHGTTDGRPYVEPTPEIGEGYRLATEADARRRDREYWNLKGRLWMAADLGVHAGNYTYRVPVDRIPTDEDAKQRPTVMVRDFDSQNWTSRTLLGVIENHFQFVAHSGYGYAAWRQCRFPYPGELE